MNSHGVTLKDGRYVPLSEKQLAALIRAFMTGEAPQKTSQIAMFHSGGYAYFKQTQLEFQSPPK